MLFKKGCHEDIDFNPKNFLNTKLLLNWILLLFILNCDLSQLLSKFHNPLQFDLSFEEEFWKKCKKNKENKIT